MRSLGEDAPLTTMFDRMRFPPFGLFGGDPGAATRVLLNPGTDREQAVAGKTTIELAPGDVVEIRSGGGGGFGLPAERNPALDVHDRRLGYIS